MLISGATAVLPTGLSPHTWFRVNDGLISEVGSGTGEGNSEPTLDLGGALVVPGFVDQHCHGGNRGDFVVGGFEGARRGAEFQTSHGTTSLLASLVTASQSALLNQAAELLPLVADGTFAGIHLEGPWLSKGQCGAHDVTQLRAPDLDEIAEVLAVADGAIRMVTLAPELPGAIAAIELLVDNQVVVALGHTDADYDTTVAAIDAGATVATHLFNGMPHIGKRHPGPVVALINDARVTLELIADGVHVHPAVIEMVISAAGPGRIAAVTDAMAAAGADDGEYVIGELAVTVTDGVARLASSGALAGSTLTMDRAFAALVNECGVDLVDASVMCATTPARAMGFPDRGSLTPGQRADLVVLDDELRVSRVMRAGRWLSPG